MMTEKELEAYKKGMKDLAVANAYLKQTGICPVVHPGFKIVSDHLSETAGDPDRKKVVEALPDKLRRGNALMHCRQQDSQAFTSFCKETGL